MRLNLILLPIHLTSFCHSFFNFLHTQIEICFNFLFFLRFYLPLLHLLLLQYYPAMHLLLFFYDQTKRILIHQISQYLHLFACEKAIFLLQNIEPVFLHFSQSFFSHICSLISLGLQQNLHLQHLLTHHLHLSVVFFSEILPFKGPMFFYPYFHLLQIMFRTFKLSNNKLKQMSEEDKQSIKLEQKIKKQGQENEAEGDGEGQIEVKMESEVQGEGEGDYDEQANSGNIQEGGSMPQGGSQQIIKKRTHRKLDISNFIMKTYKILEDKRNSSIVEWTDEGNCFIVKDKDKFSRQILPKYFKHSKFSSFVRQLNMYDFHKIRKEKQIPIFKHRYFKEGMMDQLHKIKRKNGEEGRDEDGVSKQIPNMSQPLIGLQNPSRQLISLKTKNSTQLTAHSQMELLRRQNVELCQNLNELDQQIQLLQVNKQKKKEKLMKIISSLMFFDLGLEEKASPINTLRQLQEHFVRDQDPLSFSEYRQSLSNIYSALKDKLII